MSSLTFKNLPTDIIIYEIFGIRFISYIKNIPVIIGLKSLRIADYSRIPI
jgi:hypothetical protein